MQSYCAPATHEFLPGESFSGPIRWCAVCLKEEPADASGCMICDLPGRYESTIAHDTQGLRASGRLCATCYESLSGTGIDGWSLRAVSEAEREPERRDRRR